MIVCGEKHDWNTEYYERSTFNGSYQDKDYYDYKTYVDKETFVKERNVGRLCAQGEA